VRARTLGEQVVIERAGLVKFKWESRNCGRADVPVLFFIFPFLFLILYFLLSIT
jgi:hypothetical protein